MAVLLEIIGEELLHLALLAGQAIVAIGQGLGIGVEIGAGLTVGELGQVGGGGRR